VEGGLTPNYTKATWCASPFSATLT
jgi:hypothetical protein